MRRLAIPFGLWLALLLVAPVTADPPCGRDHRVCPPPAPVAMARLVTSGAETNDATLEGATLNGATIATASQRTGTYGISCASGATNNINYTLGQTLGRTYYARAYVRFRNALPTAATGSPAVLNMNGGTTSKYHIDFDRPSSTFTLSWSGTQIGSPSDVIVPDTWYRLELKWVIGSGASDDSAEFRLDGVTVASEANQTRSTLPGNDVAAGFIAIAMDATTSVIDIDDVAINDDQGASQNTWPGPGREVLLLPTADSAKGTGWVNDANGASNFFDATNNTPPVGIADTTSSTGLHQIRNGTSNANSSYDATMTTYAVAGIDTNDTVNVVIPVTVTGAPSGTSPKVGTVGVASNPTITNVNLAGASGAFYSGVVAGTYTTGWIVSRGTTTYAPTVTVTTAPVMRITQVTSSTRIAMVCFMGIYVDYTPNAQARLLQTKQAVNRAASF